MKIEIRCPSCSKKGEIEISEDDIKNSKRGLLAVNIRSGTFCEHTYIVYIDQNCKVRDCFLTDYEIEIPDLKTKIDKKEDQIPLSEDLDTTIIKINLPISLIAYAIRGMIFKKLIRIISDQEYLYPHIYNFFEYITPDSLYIDVKIISREEYVKNKKTYNNDLILEDNDVMNDREEIMKKNDLKIERTIARRFFDEVDPKSSLIILKNELNKAVELSKSLINLIENTQEKEIQFRLLMDHLKEEKGIKVEIAYLEFLIDLIENYFEIKFKKPSDISNFLGLL